MTVTAIADARAAAWMKNLVRDEKGRTLSTASNIAQVLAHHELWKGRVGFNEFSQRVELRGELPKVPGLTIARGAVQDETYVIVGAWLHSEMGIRADVDRVAKGMATAAREYPFNQLQEWLKSQKWDGVPRVQTLLTHYFGASTTSEERGAYLADAGQSWMVAAIARAMRPGSKADHLLVLEGPQGVGKSSGLRTLAGAEYFTDELPELGSKDSAQFLRGTWVIEVAELDAMTRGEVERTKAFLSRCVDRYRPSYGRETVEVPRTCVFAGTTNAATYLKDSTGARRFWPVEVGKIAVGDIERDRSQLWAEAFQLFQTGVRWWPDAEQARIAASEQEARQQEDPWFPLVEDTVRDRARTNVTGEVEVTSEELLLGALGKPRELWGKADAMRVGTILRSLGLERARKRINGSLRWVYAGTIVPTSEAVPTQSELPL